MTANQLLKRLTQIVEDGYGDLEVFMDADESDTTDCIDVVTKDKCGYPFIVIHNNSGDYPI